LFRISDFELRISFGCLTLPPMKRPFSVLSAIIFVLAICRLPSLRRPP